MAASHYYKSLIFVPKSYFDETLLLVVICCIESVKKVTIFCQNEILFYGKNQRKFTEIRDNVSETKYQGCKLT